MMHHEMSISVRSSIEYEIVALVDSSWRRMRIQASEGMDTGFRRYDGSFIS